MPQVSIIVLTYNSDPSKLRATLAAAALQQGVDTEIVISDDGSARKDFSFLPDFFGELGFSQWKLVENPENLGTLANCCAGVNAATGEYVFLTSAGDILYDSTTMQRFYEFATAQNAQLCFGNAVRYCREDGKVRRTNLYTIPAAPDAFAAERSLNRQRTAFFGDEQIIGACYFRKTQLARKYFQALLGASKYMEDTPSTMFALADGLKVHYLDSNIVFYEDGTGVSTGAAEKWRKLLRQDLAASLSKLKQLHPHDPWVDIAYHNATQTSRIKRIACRFLRHPYLSVSMYLRTKTRKPKQIPCPQEQLIWLEQLLARYDNI